MQANISQGMTAVINGDAFDAVVTPVVVPVHSHLLLSTQEDKTILLLLRLLLVVVYSTEHTTTLILLRQVTRLSTQVTQLDQSDRFSQ